MFSFFYLFHLIAFCQSAIYFPLIHKYVTYQSNPISPSITPYGIHGYFVPLEILESSSGLFSKNFHRLFHGTILKHGTPWIALLPDPSTTVLNFNALLATALANRASSIIVSQQKFYTNQKKLISHSNLIFTTPLNIPSGFVLETDYQQIIKLSRKFETDGFLYAVLHRTDSIHSSPNWFFIATILFLIMFFTFAMYNFVNAIIHSSSSSNYSLGKLLGKRELDQIPMFKWSSQLHLPINEKCSICLEEFCDSFTDTDDCPLKQCSNQSETTQLTPYSFGMRNRSRILSLQSKMRKLPCGHFFHSFCIDPWLLGRSVLCPLCKKNVLNLIEKSNDKLSFPN